jgi:hypothetical protein
VENGGHLLLPRVAYSIGVGSAARKAYLEGQPGLILPLPPEGQ